MNHRTVLRLFALVLVFALLGTAYGQDQKVQVLYWDQVYGNQAQEAVMAQIVANFEEANPDIEIVIETLNTDVMRDIAKLSMEAGEGPDLIYYDAGPGYAGILANAGLLLPLDAAYEANNWDERLIPISRAWTTFGGNVYGVGHELEAQGLNWNKRIFAEAELELPATFADLIELCGTLRERGYEAPMAIGWGDRHAFLLMHNWYNILANYVPAETVAAMISGEHPFADPEVAADTEHPEETIRFLDYLASPETIQLWLDGGTLPAQANVDCSPCEMRPVYRDFTNLVATWEGPMAYHLDVLTPANCNTYVIDTADKIPAGR